MTFLFEAQIISSAGGLDSASQWRVGWVQENAQERRIEPLAG
jgi:hypothetical protein